MNHSLTSDIAARADGRRLMQAVFDGFARFNRTMATWKMREHTRRQLARADYRILRDIGISEADRFIECNKNFWEE